MFAVLQNVLRKQASDKARQLQCGKEAARGWLIKVSHMTGEFGDPHPNTGTPTHPTASCGTLGLQCHTSSSVPIMHHCSEYLHNYTET